MPPEQKNGHPNFCSDIYAVGTIGIECLTGISPDQLPKNADGEIIWRDRTQVSNDFADILSKMVRYHFRDRYQSATEVLQVLHSLKTPPASTVVSSSPNLFRLMSTWTREQKIGLASLVVTVIFGVAPLVVLHNPDGFTSYENQQNFLKMKYPDNWDKQEQPNTVDRQVVKFISPLEKEDDRFREEVTVIVEPSGDKTLDDYTKSSKQEILKLDKNAKIVQDVASTLAGKNGHRVVYTTKEGDRELKKLEVWTLKHDRAYLIAYEAQAGKYDEFLPVVEKMIKSLEVQDPS
jgi:eukaryotic-like serine/threonine-protein kinase